MERAAVSCPVAGRLLVLAEAEPYILVTMEITLPKIAALMVALVQVGINLAEPGSSPGSLLGGVVWPGFCLSFIWFPEYYGSFTGYVGRGGMIDTETRRTHPPTVQFGPSG